VTEEDGVYLESITLTRTQPCPAEPGKIIVTGAPSRSLDDVLPYLATLPNIISYNPGACAVTFRRLHGFMTVYSDKVIITKVSGIEEGLELLTALVDAINATWDNRAELVAATVARRAPRPLDVWALLPQTNCRECGESTCMAFAFALLQQQRAVPECPVLTTAPFADRRATLEAVIG
jgi:ArsR family metal-binding transcriptional regulator